MNLKEILMKAYELQVSDIHFMPDCPVMFRKNGRMCTYSEENIQTSDMDSILQIFLKTEQKERLEERGEVDTAVTITGFSRLRVSIYKQMGSYGAVVHILSLEIPSPQELELPSAIVNLAKESKGLILINGEAGSGKTTTTASLLSQIAAGEAKKIITVEHPIEYLLPNGRGMISQREVGSDTKTFADAVKSAMRQDVDVLFVSELSDADTIINVLDFAEAGHLVFASMCTCGAKDTLNRLISMFPEYRRGQIRAQLAGVLKGIITQQLLPRCDIEARRAVFEIMLSDKEIQMHLREGRISQIVSVMRDKKESGMQTMDDAILSAYMMSRILEETAVNYALDKEQMKQRIKIY